MFFLVAVSQDAAEDSLVLFFFHSLTFFLSFFSIIASLSKVSINFLIPHFFGLVAFDESHAGLAPHRDPRQPMSIPASCPTRSNNMCADARTTTPVVCVHYQ